MCLSIPAKLISLGTEAPLFRTGRVSFDGVVKEISLAYVPEAKVGDYVLVHVGFALSIIDAEKAQNVFKTLEELNEFHLQNETP